MRPLKIGMVALGATTALAVVAAVAFTRGAHSATPDRERTRADAPAEGRAVEQVNQQVASLRGEVAALRAREASAEKAPQAEPQAQQAQPAPAMPQSPEEIQRLIEAEVAERSELIAAHLANEPVDPAWSTKTDRAVREVVRTQLPGSQLLGVKCGSTLCEVSLSHATLDDQHQVGELASIYPFDTAAIYRYHTNVVPPRTEVYFAREGTALPSMAE